MSELSVFVDESGDFGEYSSHSPYYIITMIFHNQDKNIQPLIEKLEYELSNAGFNERNMPDSFFEVEHSTDIQNSLLKFNDLRDFYVRMVIVADERRKQEYLSKINYSSFEILNKEKRVHFLSYSQLEEEYNQELKKQEFEFVL